MIVKHNRMIQHWKPCVQAHVVRTSCTICSRAPGKRRNWAGLHSAWSSAAQHSATYTHTIHKGTLNGDQKEQTDTFTVSWLCVVSVSVYWKKSWKNFSKKQRPLYYDAEGCYVIEVGTIPEVRMTILNAYAPNEDSPHSFKKLAHCSDNGEGIFYS